MTPPKEATRAERRELHAHKMRNKAARRALLQRQTAEGKRKPVGHHHALQTKGGRVDRYGSIAIVNRHTRKPHEDAREIARRQRQAF